MSVKLEKSVGEDVVKFALLELTKNNLLENEAPNYFPKSSRRDVIKKIGLAS